jgi:gliding motility-associated-like protein
LTATDILDPYSSSGEDITYYLIASCGNLEDTADAIIQVVAPPDVEIAEDSLFMIQDQFVTLSADLISSASGVTYQWSPQGQINCNDCPSVLVSPDVTTVYSVTVTDEGGCTDVDFVYVRVMPCDETLVFIPNIITPNNDGYNDKFRITYEGISEVKQIYIFNRWGEQIFASKDPDRAWDGTFNGVLCNPGVYVYVIEATCVNGAPNIITGNITLVK